MARERAKELLNDAAEALKKYRDKRNFTLTPEPAGGGQPGRDAQSFVIQKHWASRLHYDFRLELDGTLKSWAVPKGPSLDPTEKRMAVQVEDHPISYGTFEGQIPAKQYGAGRVIVWDKGTWTPLVDARQGYRDGHLKFDLHGHKLNGRYALVRMKGKGEKQPPWLLIKEKDEFARPHGEFDVVEEMPDSVGKLGAPASAKPAPAGPAKAAPAKKAGAKNAARAPIPEGAVRAALPEDFKPELATLVDAPPQDGEWLYEMKFDGYRLLARVDGADVRLVTRNGNDWTAKMPALARAVKALKLKSGWLDGEIVVLDAKGVPSFQALQNSFDSAKTASIVYFLFDVPFLDGLDLRQVPLVQRRAMLRELLAHEKEGSPLRFSDTFDAGAQDLLLSACRIGLEGLIAKRADSAYVSRRSGDWVKLKCTQRQEFVIGGFTDPQGSRNGIGSLLLGVHDDAGALRYAGNVGSGFNEASLADIKARLDKLATDKSPFTGPVESLKKPHWVKPQLIAEVSFGEWTGSHRIRHSVFHGLRSDKKPVNIVREKPADVANAPHTTARGAKNPPDARKATVKASSPAPAAASSKLPRITHPERVLDASTGITKLDLVRYYDLVAPLMLEHLKARPVSLVRAPSGLGGELFFQKHAEADSIPGIKLMDPKLDPGHGALIEVPTRAALLSCVQMNVVEFHTWNGVKTMIDKPDRITFDLDPGEGVAWQQVQEAAQLVRVFLTELELPAFLKTSGGKGLHVVVPIKRLHDWDTVKEFSKSVVQHLAQTIGARFVAKSGPTNRVGKIFVDYLRNGRGATTVAAWSARARAGMGISVPVTWDELAGLKSGAHWTVQTAQERLRTGNAPWGDYAKSAVSIGAAIKALARARG